MGAVRDGAWREGLSKTDSVLGETVEGWGSHQRITVTMHVIRAQRVDGYEEDVRLRWLGLCRCSDALQRRERREEQESHELHDDSETNIRPGLFPPRQLTMEIPVRTMALPGDAIWVRIGPR